jgi:exodeoxyribonuclease V alpha subunit
MSALAAALYDTLLRRQPPAAGVDPALLQPLIAALIEALEQGELGLDLRQAELPEGCLEALAASSWLVEAKELAGRASDADPWPDEALLVRDGPWLRWRRWQEQLQRCLSGVITRASTPLTPAPSAGALKKALAAVTAGGLDAQQLAATEALLQRQLVLLLGGPGTGKTSTVARMLEAALAIEPQLRIQLAAPTGKAAARLSAALSGAPALPCSTLHRLLEARGSNRFGRDARRPLELDLLVVDEVSMVDLPLMSALLTALPPTARLLLVGDAGQLPPVGTGAVLEELCRPACREQLGAAVIELTTTYRNNGAIAAVAAALRHPPTSGREPLEALRPQLEQLPPEANLQWLEAPLPQLPTAVLQPLREQQQRLLELSQALRWQEEHVHPEDSAALLIALEDRIALSPLRQGPWGVEALHRALLGSALGAPLERWPLGTPVLNRLNRPEQELANGDIGVLVERDGQRLVLMSAGRVLHPARLAGAEPALALTVHKAQGSQYAEVLLLLPPSRHGDPRLLYTGLTRARKRVLLVTPVQPT